MFVGSMPIRINAGEVGTCNKFTDSTVSFLISCEPWAKAAGAVHSEMGAITHNNNNLFVYENIFFMELSGEDGFQEMKYGNVEHHGSLLDYRFFPSVRSGLNASLQGKIHTRLVGSGRRGALGCIYRYGTKEFFAQQAFSGANFPVGKRIHNAFLVFGSVQQHTRYSTLGMADSYRKQYRIVGVLYPVVFNNWCVHGVE
jgi:hypothetical protein